VFARNREHETRGLGATGHTGYTIAGPHRHTGALAGGSGLGGGARLDDIRKLCTALDAINRKVGLTVAWLALGMVLVQFTVVISRYVFSIGSIPAQETIWYMHGSLFMLGAGYTLLRDGHVRVDLFYREASVQKKARTDLLGIIFFLLPVCIFVIWTSASWVINAWNPKVLEGSTETNGIPAIFAYKTVIPIAMLLLTVQAVAFAGRCIIALKGGEAPVAEAPDETGEAVATPRSSRNLVVSIAVFLIAIEGLTFLIGLAHTGLTLAIVRPLVLFGVLVLAYQGSNWGRVTAVVGLFAAAGLSINYGAQASGDPGAIMTLLAYGNVVSAIALAIMPWAADGTPRDQGPAASPGFAVVWGIVAYVMATEGLWLVDTLLNTIGTVSFEDLPRWAVPAVIRIVLVAGLILLPFYRGSKVARGALIGYLVLSALWAVGQLVLGPEEGFITLVGTQGTIGMIAMGLLHAGMAYFISSSTAVSDFQSAQRGGEAAIEPAKSAG